METTPLLTRPKKKSLWSRLQFWRFRKKKLSSRAIYLGQLPDEEFPPNYVCNQKYNILTFLPLVLFEQFRFFLNLYFLVMALSQFIPSIRIGYLYTYWGPLCFVLAVTLFREAVDDFRRYRRDREVNRQRYERIVLDNSASDYRPFITEQVASSELRVGDIVMLHKGQRVPADMILLRTNETMGTVFIRTDQLDGEIDWKLRFYKKFKIPGVLGCIDCTQVAIIRPIIHEERYYCRKQYHSLNVQIVCDADMQILSVDASHGGATHDSFIWASHPLKAHLEELSNRENIWFLGDSGYPLRKTMVTPILDAAPGTPEAFYTDLHVHARNIVERTIGLLKARFRCLLVHRVLHYAPDVAGRIVNACVILHNICNSANVPVPQLSNEDMVQENQSQQQEHDGREQPRGNNLALQLGHITRSSLVQRLWETRHPRS